MTGFVDHTPTLTVILENPFAGLRFPQVGEALAILDTGYEGFLSVPKSTYHDLGLDTFSERERTLTLADGRLITSKGSYAKLTIPQANLKLDGLVETYPGLDEIILGTDAARRLRIVLDYCTWVVQTEICP